MSPLGPQTPVDSRRSINISKGWVKTLNQKYKAERGETVRPGWDTIGMEGTSVLRAVPPGCTRTAESRACKKVLCWWPRGPDGLPGTLQSPAPR